MNTKVKVWDPYQWQVDDVVLGASMNPYTRMPNQHSLRAVMVALEETERWWERARADVRRRP